MNRIEMSLHACSISLSPLITVYCELPLRSMATFLSLVAPAMRGTWMSSELVLKGANFRVPAARLNLLHEL